MVIDNNVKFKIPTKCVCMISILEIIIGTSLAVVNVQLYYNDNIMTVFMNAMAVNVFNTFY